MMKMTKGKIIISSITIVLFFIFLMLSTLVRYWINNNAEELTGRKIEISELHFNYAKISARIKGFRLFELDKKSDFVSFDELYVNVNPWKLITGEYSISEIYLDGLNVSVIKKLDGFNFDDLVKQDSLQRSDSLDLKKEKPNVKFAIHDIKFKNGHVNYFDLQKDNDIDLKNINIELPLIAWNNDKSEMGLNFAIGNSGYVSVNADIDHSLERYTIGLGLSSLDIHPFVSYLEDYMAVSKMEGLLDTKLAINGSMNDFMDVFVKGDVVLKEFSMYDLEENPFVSGKATEVILDSLHIGSSYYKIGRISMDSIVQYADLYSETSNFEKVFAPIIQLDSLSNDTLTSEESETSLFYQLDTIILTKGIVKFTDHSLNREFVYDLNDININMGTIAANKSKIPVSYSMNLNEGGKSSGSASFSLKDIYQFKLQGKIERLNLMSFSPYTEFYIARPITQGELTYSYNLDMTSTSLTNMNRIRVSEFDFGDRTKDPNAIKAPVRLGLYLLKDSNDQIAFELPVYGNPKDPQFKFGKIVWKTFLNFLAKTASRPFGVLGNLTRTNPESIEKIPFRYLQDSLDNDQIITLGKIAEILKKKPKLKFFFTQETNIAEEETLLAVKECVRRYLISIGQTDQLEEMIPDDQLLMWIQDNQEFSNYILNQDQTSEEFLIQENCKRILGEDGLNSLVVKLIYERNQLIENYLADSLLLKEDSFEVKTADLRNLSIEQRSPNFRIEVSLR